MKYAAKATKARQKAEIDLKAATATSTNILGGIEGGLEAFDSPALSTIRHALSLESARAEAEMRCRESVEAETKKAVAKAHEDMKRAQRLLDAEVKASSAVRFFFLLLLFSL